ncbi:MAG: DUF2127 domain-containing protein [Oscillospiraceae bacterium]|nr:DUF2127 domain-containing protein [Oscillospiraceae bacterium]
MGLKADKDTVYMADKEPETGSLKRRNRKLLDISFDIGLLLKGLFALGEVIGGAALLFLTPDRLNRVIAWISAGELSEDPTDWLMNRLVLFGHSFTLGTQHFAMFYLLSHGAIKLAVIILLWRKQLWAYPLSVVVFAGFIIYQMEHYFTAGHSILLLLLTALDVAMIVLTILEYRKMKAERRGAAAPM